MEEKIKLVKQPANPKPDKVKFNAFKNLVDSVSLKLNLPRNFVLKIITGFFHEVIGELQNNNVVRIPYFGAFIPIIKPLIRKKHIYRNGATRRAGEFLSKRIKFNIGFYLKSLLHERDFFKDYSTAQVKVYPYDTVQKWDDFQHSYKRRANMLFKQEPYTKARDLIIAYGMENMGEYEDDSEFNSIDHQDGYINTLKGKLGKKKTE